MGGNGNEVKLGNSGNEGKQTRAAGAGSQAGVEPVRRRDLSLTGGGSNEVPRSGWLGGEAKRLPQQSGSGSFWAMRFPFNVFPNTCVLALAVPALFVVLETKPAGATAVGWSHDLYCTCLTSRTEAGGNGRLLWETERFILGEMFPSLVLKGDHCQEPESVHGLRQGGEDEGD